MIAESTWWSPKRRAFAFLAAAVALVVWALIMGGQSSRYAITVGELADSRPGHVRVGGVFAEPPVTSPSGTMFTIAESLESNMKINVYFHQTTPIETQWGSRVLSGDDLVGHELIVTGVYDDQFLVAEDLIIRSSGGAYGQ